MRNFLVNAALWFYTVTAVFTAIGHKLLGARFMRALTGGLTWPWEFYQEYRKRGRHRKRWFQRTSSSPPPSSASQSSSPDWLLRIFSDGGRDEH